MRIRVAKPVEDCTTLQSIYRPYVEQTAISFECTVPKVEEFRTRMENILRRYPYFCAEENGTILGYSYAGTFKPRTAYDWAVETTVYVRKDLRGGGIGTALYSTLEQALAKMHITNMNACIAFTAQEDERLTNGSERFHTKMGFTEVAHFHKCAYKFDRWYDMIWMEKRITEQALPIIPFVQVGWIE